MELKFILIFVLMIFTFSDFVESTSKEIIIRPLLRRFTDDGRLAVQNVNKVEAEAEANANVGVGYVDQPLDHFNPLNSKYWKQRYFFNPSYYQEGAPVFIMVGGEAAIDEYWIQNATMMDICIEVNCYAFEPEHRFFGESWPIRNTEVSSLVYLTIEQGLADLAHFIKTIKKEYNLKDNKIVLVGGSYPGVLAVLFREKYPHLVDIVWASSAPIAWKYDYIEYYEIIGRVIREISPKCYKIVEQGFEALREMTVEGADQESCGHGHAHGHAQRQPRSGGGAHHSKPPAASCGVTVNETFKLCEPLDLSNRDDVSNFFATLASNFAYIGQYNNQMGRFSLENWCANIFENNTGNLSPIQKLSAFTDAVNEIFWEIPCTDPSYDNYCAWWSQTDDLVTGYRPWVWIVCAQFGSLQTSDGRDQPFSQYSFTAAFLASQCRCMFGDANFTDEFIQSNVKTEVHEVYGGIKLGKTESRVIFVNGRNDPWSAEGLLFDRQSNHRNKVIYIPGTSHCLDMVSSKPTDSDELKLARQEIKNTIIEWLND